MRNVATLCVDLFIGALLIIPASATAQNYSGAAACKGCHSSTSSGRIQYTQWAKTRHAIAFDSVAVIQNNSNCLPCHTTGWDTTLANGGFDDFYPPLTATDSTSMVKLKNVQCESCHGPVKTGVNHGQPSTINATAERCGECHQGTHHPYYDEWSLAAHAISNTNASAALQTMFRTDPNCSGCHTYQGFLEFVNQTSLEPVVSNPPGDASLPIVCATCHDPHSNANKAQLRLPPLDLCQKCHNPEYNPDAPTPDGGDLHHTTAFMLEGKGGYHYAGYTYESSVHTDVADERCVTCHVVMTPFVSGEVPASTGHTFMPKGVKCIECHSDFDTLSVSFDYHGVQTEIDSLVHELELRLAATSSADSASDAFKQAKFNHDFVVADGSRGVHNTNYARGLLLSALQNYNPTSVDRTEGIPAEFALQQNYPNPFNPTTSIEFSVASKGLVRVQVFDMLGRLVKTIVDREFQPGNYRATWDGTDRNNLQVSSGIYLYTLDAREFSMTKKMILLR